MTLPVPKRFLQSFALVAAVTMAFTIVASGSAHMVSALVAQDLYDIAVGDHVLPDPLVSLRAGGPLLIAIQVTWWFGLVAAPIVYAIVGGLHGDLHPGRVVLAAATGMAASSFVLMAAASLNPAWRDRWGDSVFVSLLDYGYWALGVGLITMALMLRMRRSLAD